MCKCRRVSPFFEDTGQPNAYVYFQSSNHFLQKLPPELFWGTSGVTKSSQTLKTLEILGKRRRLNTVVKKTCMRKLGNVRVRENTCMKKTSRQSVYTTPIPKSMNKMEPKKVNPSKLLNIKLARSAIHTNLLEIAGNCHKTKQKPHKHILCNWCKQ